MSIYTLEISPDHFPLTLLVHSATIDHETRNWGDIGATFLCLPLVWLWRRPGFGQNGNVIFDSFKSTYFISDILEPNRISHFSLVAKCLQCMALVLFFTIWKETFEVLNHVSHYTSLCNPVKQLSVACWAKALCFQTGWNTTKESRTHTVPGKL